ncbi:hypothetical protein Glove_350g173 [Diversispora epigaea]|uniref:Histone deacetylase domain-containing protein n=1 Tax=Diversispora epigaea TaxID=1348612 RepID=A0A397HI31_9GLOM|nr:hypothetical protein Glove_350g173 [Diversispora epigaea]
MKVFYSDVCLKHAPQYEILSGNFVEYVESPSRITLIKEHLSQFPEKFEICSHLDYGLEPILSIHDNDYIEYLKTAYIEWCNDGGDKKGVIPETFLHKGILNSSKKNLKNIKSPLAKAGFYCFDLSCCITEDTWEASYESAQVCISAAMELLKLTSESYLNESNYIRNSPLGIFALCRPPGHHANRNVCGGYCYLNNAAIATKLLIENNKKDNNNNKENNNDDNNNKENNKLVILDIDYHHGNGTQDIFYSQSNPLYVSLHESNDYPYFTGDESEIGEGDGKGYNINISLKKETVDDEYLEKLKIVIQDKIIPYNADFLVVSLGVDTYKDDPIGGCQITTLGYKRIGNLIKSIGLPTLFIMEGGYHLETLKFNVYNVLSGFDEDEDNC